VKKIVYFYSQEELPWHRNHALQDLVADEKPNIYCHIELLRQLKTRKNWVVECCRMDEVYAKRGYREAEAIIIDKCRDSDYAWFMSTARPQFLTDRTFGAIKARCPATQIILNSHDELKYHSIMTCCLAQDADVIIVSDHPIGAEKLRRLFGNAVFFHSHSRNAFPPRNSPVHDYDISFIGTPKSKRADYVAAITATFPQLNSRFVLPTRPYYTSPERLDLEQILELTYRSKINLVCNEKAPGALHLSWRFWQVVLCQALPLVEYAPDLDYLFDVKNELFIFRDERELLEQITFILDPEHREIVDAKRHAAYARASALCLEDLVEMMDNLQSGAEILSGLAHPARLKSAPLEPSTPTHKRYKATRYQYLFRFLSRGQIRKALPELSVLRYGFPDASWLKEIRHLRQVGRRIGEQ
jgi:hypothetical protein